MGSVFFLAFIITLGLIFGSLFIGISLIKKGIVSKKQGSIPKTVRNNILAGSIMLIISITNCAFCFAWSNYSQKKQENFILYFVQEHDYERVEELLESGVPADSDSYSFFKGNTESSYGYDTPLFIASACQDYKMITLLLKYGANPDRETTNNYTPFCEAMDNNSYLMMDFFFEYGADPNHIMSDGNSYLVHAFRSGDIIAVRRLLEHGANPNVKDNEGISLLNYKDTSYDDPCYKMAYEQMIELLKEYGAVSD